MLYPDNGNPYVSSLTDTMVRFTLRNDTLNIHPDYFEGINRSATGCVLETMWSMADGTEITERLKIIDSDNYEAIYQVD